MSNDSTEKAKIQEWVKEIAQPGTVFRWQWAADGATIVAYVEVSGTNSGNTIEATRWNLGGLHEFSRPAGVPRGGNIPAHVFYAAAMAGDVQLVNLVSLRDNEATGQ